MKAVKISSISDVQLLEAIRQDDEIAFAELFKRYWKKMHSIVFSRVRSVEATNEIVQGLFISLWKKRKTLLIDHLQSYLYTSVKNRILNHLESQMTQRKHWEYYRKFIPEAENTTERDVALNEAMEVIENEVELLPEKSKTIFRLNRLEGQSVSEIANSLNLSEKAIQYHITKSLKTLRLHLKDYILTLSFLMVILPI
ncbi:MAG TPA: RNA polymerase sigma-70 factor [Cyclobacteriaceae bacterium]|nr:RNA polymerase sigma-70 factor [Cyclobacteriaceae bacterium]